MTRDRWGEETFPFKSFPLQEAFAVQARTGGKKEWLCLAVLRLLRDTGGHRRHVSAHGVYLELILTFFFFFFLG